MSSSKDLELENLYSSLLHESSPHEKAIQKDLTRTFPSHKFFQRPQSADGEDMDERGRGQDELFNVVKAYSLYDPDVGYVQGSAFIVASLLLNVSLCSVPSPPPPVCSATNSRALHCRCRMKRRSAFGSA